LGPAKGSPVIKAETIMSKAPRLEGARGYFLLCFLLWVVVDLGTAGGFRLSYLARYMPALLTFYVGYPLVFTYLVYRRRLGGRGLFVATLVAIFVVEAILTGNPWLIAFPLCLVGIPLAIAVYAPLAYFPLWAVRGELGRHRRMVVALCCVEAAVMALTTLGKGG
jgi:hypothetical protein